MTSKCIKGEARERARRRIEKERERERKGEKQRPVAWTFFRRPFPFFLFYLKRKVKDRARDRSARNSYSVQRGDAQNTRKEEKKAEGTERREMWQEERDRGTENVGKYVNSE